MKKLRNSIYVKLLVRFILLLILPTVIISSVLYANLQKQMEEQTFENTRKIAQQLEAAINSKLGNVEDIGKNLATNNTLTTFLNATYHEAIDYSLYSTSVMSFVKGVIGMDYQRSVQIFMANKTIPEGFGVFYQLSSVEGQEGFREFLESDNKEAFITADRFRSLTGIFAVPGNSLVYLSKIYNGGRVTALIKITLPESSLWNNQSGYRLISSEKDRILDFTTGEQQEAYNFPEKGTGMAGEVCYARVEVDRLPFSIIVTTDYPPAATQASWLNTLWILVVIIAICIMIKTLFQWTRKVYLCLDQMNASIQQNFAPRLPVVGNDEIAGISQNINLLLDKIKGLMDSNVEQERLSKQTQIYALQNQINPHFIYNTMEIFSSQMELYGHYNESEAMSDFARMLRYNINASERYATLQQEIDHLKSYLNIQRLRYPDIVCTLSIPRDLYSRSVIRFLLQPFVENSIRHGLNRFNPKLRIFVSAVKSAENEMLFTIYDNGTGMDQKAVEALNKKLQSDSYTTGDSAVGIENINRRIRLYFGDQYKVQVFSQKSQWTMISFSIPIVG